MKLLNRILLAPLVAVGCLVLAGQLALMGVRDIAGKFEILRDQKFTAARDLDRVDAAMATVNAVLYRTIMLIESSDAKSVDAVRQRIGTETDAQIAGLKAVTLKVDAALGKELENVVANLDAYRKNAQQALTLAEVSPGAAVTMLASAERSFSASTSSLHRVSQAVHAEVETLSQEVLDVSSRARLLVMALTLGAAAASATLAVWVARRVVQRLDHAVLISEAIARGELDVDVPTGDGDEVGRLLRSLERTVGRLGQSLNEIRQATGSIHTASTEIAAGGQDLSTRTEQAAGNLQETASSINLLNGAVEQSASAAHQASELARTASAVAARGGELVSEVVVRMQDINTSATQISDIISVIDGIAFQTNILALNAAVEAARAGEQGRGFAVVAGEVRSLAGRAAEAAKQIKVLIGASVEKADSGVKLVRDAGATMAEIVAAVRRVDAMIAEISTSAGGQASGIVEINRAVMQLDQMTQQNSALVEQSAAASESLKEQVLKLNDVVGTFRLRV